MSDFISVALCFSTEKPNDPMSYCYHSWRLFVRSYFDARVLTNLCSPSFTFFLSGRSVYKYDFLVSDWLIYLHCFSSTTAYVLTNLNVIWIKWDTIQSLDSLLLIFTFPCDQFYPHRIPCWFSLFLCVDFCFCLIFFSLSIAKIRNISHNKIAINKQGYGRKVFKEYRS